MNQTILNILDKYGISGITLIVIILLWASWRKKLNIIVEMAEGDVMERLTEIKKFKDDLEKENVPVRLKSLETHKDSMRTSIQFLGERKLGMEELKAHCEVQHGKCLSRDEIFKVFSTKESTDAIFSKVELALSYLMDEVKGMRHDFKEVWQKK